MNDMRISQLAERSGVPATTLRYYEGVGLLSAGRTPAGYRTYGAETVERLEFITAAKYLGLPLDEIRELLGVWESGSCAEVKADLHPRITARLAEADQRRAELDAFGSILHGALTRLDAMADRAGRCDAECDNLTAPADTDAERWRTAPVACSLTREQLSERTSTWHDAVGDAERSPIPDGVRLTVPVDRTSTVAALAADEQRCCPFFDFRLHLDGAFLHLEVRAPAMASDMLRELFEAA